MTDLPRFFIPKGELTADEILITSDPLHHLNKVLRLKVGDQAILLDGTGACCRARISALGRHQAKAEPLERWQEIDTALPICLQQALPKGDKLDLVLQKGTELGITRFQPVTCQRSVPQADPQRLQKRSQRWARIISEAARQSRRSVLPELGAVRPLAEAVQMTSDHLRLVLWEQGATPLHEALPAQRPAGVTLLVGPEGGFAPEEVTLVHLAGFQPVHLGPRILRTETAGLAAASILQYLYGDLNLAPTQREETS